MPFIESVPKLGAEDKFMPTETQPTPSQRVAQSFDIGPEDTDIDGAPVPPQAPRAAAAPSAPAQRPKHEHNSHLVGMARDFGFSEAEINDMTPADLAAQVRGGQRLLLQERNQRSAAVAVDPQRPSPGGGNATAAGGAPAAASTPVAAPTVSEDEFGLRAVKEDLDERFYSILDKMAQKIQKLSRLEALEPEVKGLRQTEQQRQQRQAFDAIDTAFDLLGPDYEKQFGKGTAAELKDTPEMKRRVAVVRLTNLDWSKNPTPKAIAAILKIAADDLFGSAQPVETAAAVDPYGVRTNGQPAAPTKKPTPPRGADGKFLPPTPEEWEEGQVQRPSQRNGSAEPKGTKRAMKAVERWNQEHGVGDDNDANLDGFLG